MDLFKKQFKLFFNKTILIKMHLFSFDNDEDRDSGVNKCKNSGLTFLVDSLFCPMTRLTTLFFADKWKGISKTSEFKFVLVSNRYLTPRVSSIPTKKPWSSRDFRHTILSPALLRLLRKT